MVIKKNKSIKGGILLLSIGIMSLLVSLAAIFIQKVLASTREAQSKIDRAQALYVAEAGIQKILYYLNNTDPAGNTDGSWRTRTYSNAAGTCSTIYSSVPNLYYPCQETITLGDGSTGTYTMWVTSSGMNVQITSQGTYQGITRTLQATTTPTLSSGLKGWWKFTEGAGTSASDYSGNGNTATLSGGGASWGSSTLHDNMTHGYFTFNASNYFNTGAKMVQKDAFSVALWVNPTAAVVATTNYSGFIGNSGWSGSGLTGYHMGFAYATIGVVRRTAFYIEQPTGSTNGVVHSNNDVGYTGGTWYHFVGTFNPDGTVCFYVNGTSKGCTWPGTVTALYTSSYNLQIGRDPQGGWTTPQFSGSISDVRIFNRTLNGNEVAQLYNGYGSVVLLSANSLKEI